MRPGSFLLLIAAWAGAAAAQTEQPPAAAGQLSPQTAAPVLATPAAPAQAPLPWTEAAARETLAEVRAAANEGLDPADYGEAALAAALAAGDMDAVATAAQSAWMALARDYAAGRTPESARIGWKSPLPRSDPDWLRAKLSDGLAAGAPGQALRALLPTHPHYAALKEALRTAPAGPDRARIRANLDRWRWMPRLLGTSYMFANVPSFELDLWLDETLAARHRIIVGATKTPTPQFSTVATAVIINPPWILPQSIIAESVGGLIRRSPATARAKGYRWTQTAEGLSVTQLPGAGNSLGTLKIEMPNPYAIYFHDTPNKALFARPVRAFSHGCMRTQGILGLALRLLEDQPEWDAARIDATAATNETVRVPLGNQMPAHVAYFTVTPGPRGTIRTHPDIYGRDAPVMAVFAD